MPSQKSIVLFAARFATVYSGAVLLLGVAGVAVGSKQIPADSLITGLLGLAVAWALWLADRQRGGEKARAGMLAVLCGLLTASAAASLILTATSDEAPRLVGRLPVISAACFGLLAAAVLLATRRGDAARLLSNGLAYFVLAMCLATLFAQFFAISSSALSLLNVLRLPWAHIPIFVAAAVGVLSIDRENEFPQFLYADSAPATQLRLLLPAMIAVPLIFGLFVIQVGETLAPATAVALTTIATAITGAVIVAASARYLAVAEQELADRAAELQRALQREETAHNVAVSSSSARDTFVSFVGHELRAPLNAALTWLDLMALKPDEETLNKGTEIIRNSIETQIRLIEDLSDIARVTSGELSLEPERFDLPETIVGLIAELEPLFAAKSIALTYTLSESLGTIDGDAMRLQQVIRNLLVNAHRYTPAGGTVKLAATVMTATCTVSISVSDTGIGINSSDLNHVFEPYWRAGTTVPGLGIGLALARAIVEAHGGRLTASSAGEGQGATFTAFIPLRNVAIDDTAHLPQGLLSGADPNDNQIQ